jgi:hypothetical protein
MERYSNPELGAANGSNGTKMRLRQRLKIIEIGDALCAAGHVCLDEQARVLGLSRSTTWALLQARHKSSGLTVDCINRMLEAPNLPSPVRAKIIEYVEEKAAGLYGHKDRVRGIFLQRISRKALPGIAREIRPSSAGQTSRS